MNDLKETRSYWNLRQKAQIAQCGHLASEEIKDMTYDKIPDDDDWMTGSE